MLMKRHKKETGEGGNSLFTEMIMIGKVLNRENVLLIDKPAIKLMM